MKKLKCFIKGTEVGLRISALVIFTMGCAGLIAWLLSDCESCPTIYYFVPVLMAVGFNLILFWLAFYYFRKGYEEEKE